MYFYMTTHLKFHLDKSLQEQGVVLLQPGPGDAGFDIRSAADYEILPNQQILISTGLRLAIPQNWVGVVRERSSTALKRLYCHAGVIDSNYRGEIKIVIANGGNEPYKIQKGDKIAQLLVLPCLTLLQEVDSEEGLGATDRGEKGFGSSGR